MPNFCHDWQEIVDFEVIFGDSPIREHSFFVSTGRFENGHGRHNIKSIILPFNFTGATGFYKTSSSPSSVS